MQWGKLHFSNSPASVRESVRYVVRDKQTRVARASFHFSDLGEQRFFKTLHYVPLHIFSSFIIIASFIKNRALSKTP